MATGISGCARGEMSDRTIEVLVEEEMFLREILNGRERVTDISRRKREGEK